MYKNILFVVTFSFSQERFVLNRNCGETVRISVVWAVQNVCLEAKFNTIQQLQADSCFLCMSIVYG